MGGRGCHHWLAEFTTRWRLLLPKGLSCTLSNTCCYCCLPVFEWALARASVHRYSQPSGDSGLGAFCCCSMTFWEQIDDGVQFTATRKFFTVIPVVLFLLASHGKWRTSMVFDKLVVGLEMILRTVLCHSVLFPCVCCVILVSKQARWQGLWPHPLAQEPLIA